MEEEIMMVTHAFNDKSVRMQNPTIGHDGHIVEVNHAHQFTKPFAVLLLACCHLLPHCFHQGLFASIGWHKHILHIVLLVVNFLCHGATVKNVDEIPLKACYNHFERFERPSIRRSAALNSPKATITRYSYYLKEEKTQIAKKGGKEQDTLGKPQTDKKFVVLQTTLT
ncbi:hypothetical protein L7F22_024356 [Adiantum nelumboides]|nr:hypothetical protein [Adiantum nelumboides]